MELGFYPKVHRALRRAGSLLESYSSSEPKWISSAGIAADWRLQSLLSAAVGVQPLPVCACFKLRLYQCVCLSSRVSFASLALSALLFLKRETLAEKKWRRGKSRLWRGRRWRWCWIALVFCLHIQMKDADLCSAAHEPAPSAEDTTLHAHVNRPASVT